MLSSSTLNSHGFNKGVVVLSCNSFLDQSHKVLHAHLFNLFGYFSSSFWQSKERDVNIPPWNFFVDISLDFSPDDSDSSLVP